MYRPIILILLATVFFNFSIGLTQAEIAFDPEVAVLHPEHMIFPVEDTPSVSYEKVSDVYPYVTEVILLDDVVSLAEDTLYVSVAVYNPSGSVLNGAEVSVELREPGTGYVALLPTVLASLAASDTTHVEVAWVPDVPVGGLFFDVVANVTLPFNKKATPCSNKITNGSFDSGGTGGWTLVNNLPPSLGAKATFGNLDVYSTTTNTVDQRAAQAYQRIPLEAGESNDWLLQYRTKLSADDGIYGYGIAYTFVYFLGPPSGNSYPVLGGFVHWASTVSAPADGSVIYDRTSEGTWHVFQLDVGAMAADREVAITDSTSLIIGSVAMPYCPAGYCTSTAHAYLDDVSIFTCPESAKSYEGALALSDLGKGIIGSRADLLRDCYGEDPSTGEKFAKLIPYVSTLYMWEDMFANACAAGVYKDSGDDLLAGLAAFMSFNSFLRPVLTQMSSLGLVVSGFSIHELSSEVLNHVAFHGPLEAAQEYLRQGMDEPAKSTDFPDRLIALEEIAVEGQNTFRHVDLIDGPVDISIVAGSSTSDPDWVRHIGANVLDAPDSTRQWVSIADTVQVLGTGEYVTSSNPLDVQLLAWGSGNVDVGLVLQEVGGNTSRVIFPTCMVTAGDLLTYGPVEPTSEFLLEVDRGGDGSVDETLTGEVQGTSPVQNFPGRPYSLFQNSPNPFNPVTKIAFEIPDQTAVSLRVYDMSGHLVRVLLDGQVFAKGLHQEVWNGRDESGRIVAAGVYFYRLEATDYSQTKPMALVK